MPNNNPHFSKILLTTDFSAASNIAFGYAAKEAQLNGASVTIAHVIEGFSVPFVIGEFAPSAELVEQLRTAAMKKGHEELDKIVDRLKREYPEVQFSKKVLDGIRAVGDIINEYAKTEKFDLIVMSSHGYGLLQRIVLGSVAERVLRSATCPVLVIPSHK